MNLEMKLGSIDTPLVGIAMVRLFVNVMTEKQKTTRTSTNTTHNQLLRSVAAFATEV